MFFYICHSNDNGGASLSYLCTGPMARHASDLLPMLQILAEDKAPLLELDKEVDLDKLRVFWLEDDGGFPVITPVHRFPFIPLMFIVHTHMLCRDLREAQRKLVRALQTEHPSMQVERAPGLSDLFHSLPIW